MSELSNADRYLPNGAYGMLWQGEKQRVDLQMVKAVELCAGLRATIIDLGCGVGYQVKRLRDEGWEAYGVDGTPGIEYNRVCEWVTEQDLTQSCSKLIGQYDFGVCTEVGEHIPRKHEQKFLDNLAAIPKSGLFVTWADRETQCQPGHINCRSTQYISGELCRRGWRVDDDAIHKVRSVVMPKYRNRLIVLRRASNG